MNCVWLVIYRLIVFAHKAIMCYRAVMKLCVLFGEFIDLLLKLRSFIQWGCFGELSAY